MRTTCDPAPRVTLCALLQSWDAIEKANARAWLQHIKLEGRRVTAPPVVTVDFETFPIQQRPHYPPAPVGVAIKWPNWSVPYYATGEEMRPMLGQVWDSSLPILFHNAKFDLAVVYERFAMPRLPWDRVHDTMFLAYLYDPHARELGLKELAEGILRWAPEERNELNDWIWAHRHQLETDSAGRCPGKVKKSKFGEWIWAAPADLVGKYAIGDVARTEALFKHLWPIIQNEGMGAAYGRERQLLPILMENEELGMRVDLERLHTDVQNFGNVFEYVEDWLRRELKASGLNFDADRDVANVLLTRGIVPQEHWQLTESGQLSTSKETLLPKYFTGPNGAQIASALGYRNRLKTCLEMFMRPWLNQAAARNGAISTNWNQVRNPEGGTRTGRPSTQNPNFLNISKSFDGRTDGYQHPEFLNVPRLPLCRRYILPDEGHTLIDIDFNGQELRIFAHFEQGALWQQYQRNPKIDVHAFVGDEIKRIAGRELERTKVKVLNFQALYGGGVPAAQRKLDCSYVEAKQYKSFHDQALPGRKHLNDVIKSVVRRREPIRTWGGRYYRPETPRVVDGRLRNFEYKLINYLIQGSAADLTKQTVIDWWSTGPRSRFMVQVYDEVVISAPSEIAREELANLQEVMEAPRLTVPMLADPAWGPNWQDVKDVA